MRVDEDQQRACDLKVDLSSCLSDEQGRPESVHRLVQFVRQNCGIFDRFEFGAACGTRPEAVLLAVLRRLAPDPAGQRAATLGAYGKPGQ